MLEIDLDPVVNSIIDRKSVVLQLILYFFWNRCNVAICVCFWRTSNASKKLLSCGNPDKVSFLAKSKEAYTDIYSFSIAFE